MKFSYCSFGISHKRSVFLLSKSRKIAQILVCYLSLFYCLFVFLSTGCLTILNRLLFGKCGRPRHRLCHLKRAPSRGRRICSMKINLFSVLESFHSLAPLTILKYFCHRRIVSSHYDPGLVYKN